MSEEERYEVTAEEAGERLDRFLVARTGRSRSALQRWVSEGRVALDGAVQTSAKAKVRAGTLVAVRPAPPPVSEARAQPIPIEVLHEDEHLVVVSKAAGMVVHPAPGHPDGTLVNALLHRTTFRDGGDPMRPGIVHRLDKDTSGLLVAAKNDAAHTALARQFADRSLSRRYFAVVWGLPQPTEGAIEGNIGRHPVHRKKMAVLRDGGRPALTRYRVVEAFAGGAAAAVECRLETGRTHQIRVHLAARGHPLIGDPLYGRGTARRRAPAAVREAATLIARQALHAQRLSFRHPRTGAPMRFESPVPADIAGLIAALRHAGGAKAE